MASVPPPGAWLDVEAAIAIWCLEDELLDPRDAARAIIQGRLKNVSPLGILFENAQLDRALLLPKLAEVLGYGWVDLGDESFDNDIQVIQNAGLPLLRAAKVVPLRKDGVSIVVSANPRDPSVAAAVERMFQDDAAGIQVMLADPAAVVARLYVVEQRMMLSDIQDSAFGGDDAPVEKRPQEEDEIIIASVATDDSSNVAWVKRTLDRAVELRTSDIHFGLTEAMQLVVRFRVDGEMRQQIAPEGRADRVLNAAMQFSNMDIGAQRRTQSTSFTHITARGKKINIRAELLPSINGPKMTWRLLDAKAGLRRLDDMGLDENYVETLKRVMTKRHGLIVTTGPTGSGKTTTQYGLLGEVMGRALEIITIEDPVEYKLPGLTQVQVNLKARNGVTWDRAIESSLRSDPDIILVGECRDPSTASTAVAASMTGHLVLTTLHTTSAMGVYARLIDMGVEPFLLADQLTLSIGQRLVPRLHSCAIRQDIPQRDLELLAASGITTLVDAMYPKGCDLCDGSGFLGRAPLMELLLPDLAIKNAVMRRASDEEIMEVCSERNYLQFPVDGERLLRLGWTSPDRLIPLLSEKHAAIQGTEGLQEDSLHAVGAPDATSSDAPADGPTDAPADSAALAAEAPAESDAASPAPLEPVAQPAASTPSADLEDAAIDTTDDEIDLDEVLGLPAWEDGGVDLDAFINTASMTDAPAPIEDPFAGPSAGVDDELPTSAAAFDATPPADLGSSTPEFGSSETDFGSSPANDVTAFGGAELPDEDAPAPDTAKPAAAALETEADAAVVDDVWGEIEDPVVPTAEPAALDPASAGNNSGDITAPEKWSDDSAAKLAETAGGRRRAAAARAARGGAGARRGPAGADTEPTP